MIRFYGVKNQLMINTIRQYHAQAVEMMPEIANYQVFVTLNDRMRSNGGTAKVMAGYGYIELNYRLFMDNPAELKQTYLHELAHIVQRKRYGYDKKVKSHGIEWQRIMRQFGIEPDRCHKMDISALKSNCKKFLYKCGCQTHAIGPVRHNRILKGSRYTCKSCKQKLVRA